MKKKLQQLVLILWTSFNCKGMNEKIESIDNIQ